MPMADRRELIKPKPTLIEQILRSTRCADRCVHPCESRVRENFTDKRARPNMRVVMKLLVLGVVTVLTFSQLRAQQAVWQPSPGHEQLPIWPGTAPDARPMKGPEDM